eukprot:5806472-Ditylum_brightwellii.AAC.1
MLQQLQDTIGSLHEQLAATQEQPHSSNEYNMHLLEQLLDAYINRSQNIPDHISLQSNNCISVHLRVSAPSHYTAARSQSS